MNQQDVTRLIGSNNVTRSNKIAGEKIHIAGGQRSLILLRVSVR